jgi:hypothetical protein
MDVPADKDPVSLTLAAVCVVLVFLPISHHTMDQRVWYNYSSLKDKIRYLWTAWIVILMLSSVCLYLSIRNISEFSRPSSDIAYGTWVVSGMILLTMFTIKMWLPFSAIIDTKDNGAQYTNIERVKIFANSDYKEIHLRPDQKKSIYVYCAFLDIVAIITMILIAINFTETKSYISVTVIWAINLLLILVVSLIVYVKVNNSPSGNKKIRPVRSNSHPFH